MDSTINNIDQLKPKKFLSLGRHKLRYVGDLSKPFFITVGCSHTKGVSLSYSDTWANNIAKLFNMEHINLGFSGSSLEYQLSLITRAENILPKAKFILWMHTYPSRSHKFFLSHILGDKLCRVQKENFLFYKDEIEQDYNLDSWNKLKTVVEQVKNKKVFMTNCWGYNSGLKTLMHNKICKNNFKYFLNQDNWIDHAPDNAHAGIKSHAKIAQDWFTHITKHYPNL
tara:strand:- start:1019 stop:1696 length:678 start_codon:yes stop_codon:yes gene_type:complete